MAGVATMTSSSLHSQSGGEREASNSSRYRSRSISIDLAAEGGLTSSDPNEVREWLVQHNHKKQISTLDKFLIELRRGRLTTATAGASKLSTTNQQQQQASSSSTSLSIAFKLVKLLLNMIGSINWKSAAELLCLLRGLGREIQSNGKDIIVIGNIVRRFMAAVREEVDAAHQEETKKQGAATTTSTGGGAGGAGRLSLESMLWALPQHVRPHHARTKSNSTAAGSVHHHHPADMTRDMYERQESALSAAAAATEENVQQVELYPPYYYIQRGMEFKQSILEAIQEIITDLEDLHKNINEQAVNHIHSGEVILTTGYPSKTIELFLKAAAKNKRTFQVIVVVSSISNNNNNGTYHMAKSLADAGIETTIVSESAVFAVMARVHKVLLSARAVLANGGLVSSMAGSNLIAVAAKHHSVPVQCVTGLFKLCPRYPHEGQDTLNDLHSPQQIIGSRSHDSYMIRDVEVINPVYDYIEPKHIGLYITNVGSFQPSFIYRMLAENYHTDDWDSFEG